MTWRVAGAWRMTEIIHIPDREKWDNGPLHWTKMLRIFLCTVTHYQKQAKHNTDIWCWTSYYYSAVTIHKAQISRTDTREKILWQVVITTNNNFPAKQEAVTLYHFLFFCIKAADHEVLVNTVTKPQLDQKAVVQDRQPVKISNKLMGGKYTGIMWGTWNI